MYCTTSQISAINRLLKEMDVPKREVHGNYRQMLETAFHNLPVFLREFCFLYYLKQKSLRETAETLGIHISLAEQRRVVSIALFRILLASKPKGPV